ncbi:hypothetical protein COB11_05290 [Candidatus Aerophobetes bacterium]|uniref:PAS domain-containing protein n=1 Tax=Aerophobetes bacterium TaxID=2030807 RepID=A0A2A4YFR9_UNCAE|nr:MAG: hypothetical protein COB11_05290 [Candidatus Aerophobetes bacterium]
MFRILWQASRAEVLGKIDHDFKLKNKFLGKSLALESRMLEDSESYLVRELICTKRGAYYPVLAKKEVVEYEKGFKGIICSLLVEEDLQKEFSNVEILHDRNIIDQLEEVYICWKDSNSAFRGFNENFLKLVGKSREELIGVQDPFSENHIKCDAEIRKTKKPKLHMVEKIPSKKGKPLYILTNKGVWKDPEGRVIGTAVCFFKAPVALEPKN